eukprot:Skav230140  [mRNA]  locus=scaffold1301:174255:177327:- [translate_table: standard]
MSGTGSRSYYVQGIDSTLSKTGEVFYGVEVKDSQANYEFKYGPRWTDNPCVTEEFQGTWTADSVVCDSTSGSISGTDCINLFAAVEASICWQIANPVVCIDNKLVSGTLSAYASLKLVAADETVTSSPMTVLDLSSIYSCSGDSYQVGCDQKGAWNVMVFSWEKVNPDGAVDPLPLPFSIIDEVIEDILEAVGEQVDLIEKKKRCAEYEFALPEAVTEFFCCTWTDCLRFRGTQRDCEVHRRAIEQSEAVGPVVDESSRFHSVVCDDFC